MTDIVEPITGTIGLVRGFFRVRRDPDPFLAGLAFRAIEHFPFPLDDRCLLDLGCGTGHLGHQLERLGHSVVSTDLSFTDLVDGRPPRAFHGDATALGVATASVDGVICSNILEHTPTPDLVFGEIERVLADGGWAWVSWTPWWGPFGGHAIAPMHYFGAERGLRWYTRLFGPPTGKNLPNDGVWQSTIGQILDVVESRPDLELLDAFPRYYPRLRWLLRLRRAREVATWNCVLLIRRTPRH